MKRTTITLSDDLAQVLERERRRRATSASALVREALAEYLVVSPARPRKIPFAALGRSGHRHTARDMDHILAREWSIARHR